MTPATRICAAKTLRLAALCAFLMICGLSSSTYAQQSAPALTEPLPGTQLPGSSVLFRWTTNGTNVKQWHFRVGLEPGSTEFANKRLRSSNILQHQVDGLPTNGEQIFVEFSYRASGSWKRTNLQFQAFDATGPDNLPPNARNDSAGPVNAGQNLIISVLSNDDDTDGTIDPATVTIVSAPAAGSATVQANGQISYTHNGDTGTGSDSLRYTVQDDDGDTSNIAIVTLSPIIDPDPGPQQPTIVSPLPGTQLPGTDVTFTWTAGSVVVNQWYFRAGLSPGSGEFASIRLTNSALREYQVTGLPDNGSPVFIEFSYRDSNSKWVRQIVEYQAFDGNTTVNKAPVAMDDLAGPLDAGQSLTINVLGNDSDADGTIDPATVVIVSAPSSGTATAQVDGRITYSYDGTAGAVQDVFTYTVKDDDGAISNDATVTITLFVDPEPENEAPIAMADTAGPVVVGQSLTFDVLGNDTDADGTLAPDTVTIVSQPTAGAAQVEPDGQITYRHDGPPGTVQDTLTYTVRDDDGALSNEASVIVSPIVDPNASNDAPVASDDVVGPVGVGGTIVFPVIGNDIDNDGSLMPNTVTIIDAPVQGTATVAANGQVTYMHDGTTGIPTDLLVYTVTDDDGATSNSATATILIGDACELPAAQ